MMSRYLKLLTVGILLFSPALVNAQEDLPMSVERSRVLSQFGESESLQLSLPINNGIGVVASQVIKRSGASALRIHFSVSQPLPAASWGVQISDKHDKKIWSYSAVSEEPDFWSDEVPGDTAKIQVFSVAEVPTLRLTIDRIIVSKNPTVVKSLTVDKLMAIDRASPEIQQWGRSVARLLFIDQGSGKQFLCSGFLVGPDLFLTNNHCIDTDSEMRSGLAEFDYDKSNATPLTLRFKKILNTNRELDFTLLRLTTNPGRQPLPFDLNPVIEPPAPSTEPRALVVIEHPAGKPKQVSIENCKVLGGKVAGITAALTDFGHGCDTLGGSSGSPVLDIKSGKVLGLHHLGFPPNATRPVNRAVKIRQILDFLMLNLTDTAARQALGLPVQ
jgi:hypothetical protein